MDLTEEELERAICNLKESFKVLEELSLEYEKLIDHNIRSEGKRNDCLRMLRNLDKELVELVKTQLTSCRANLSYVRGN